MSEDRTGEMRSRIEGLSLDKDRQMRRMHVALGRLFILMASHRPTRWFLERPFSAFASWMIVEREMMGVRRGRKTDVLEIAENWLRIPTLLGLPYTFESADDEKVVIVWHECAVGYEDPSCLPACRASCNIDVRTVSRLGGKLEVTENMLEGAPLCRFVISRSAD
jgi:hypothetical protein